MSSISSVELFCGTKSFSKVAQSRGITTLTIDNDIKHNPDICISVFDITKFKRKYDILWASPPCNAFSVASISHHWKGGLKAYIPQSAGARLGLRVLDKTIQIISITKPKLWYIENPRGVMRKVIDEIFAKHGIKKYVRQTVTYCKYGDKRMKPTDIWTNDFLWIPRPMSKNGDSDHEPAPRGSKTGTQGLKGAIERGVIPPELFEEILSFRNDLQSCSLNKMYWGGIKHDKNTTR